MRRGILLIQLGTPAEPSALGVVRYLREFLSDARVLDLPAAGRALLLYGAILPLRTSKTAAAYRKIWTAEGSPLLVHSKELLAKLRARLPGAAIELGMRYGQPSIRAALERLRWRGCDELTVLPLYPQYASSSTGSGLALVYREAARLWNTPFVRVVPPFHADAGFQDAIVRIGRPVLADLAPDHVLFSFHGLPERHIAKSDEGRGYCLSAPACCDALGADNVNCYRAQCFATARALAASLALAPGSWSTTFQSRLGRTPWIRPYTDLALVELAERGARKVAVFCPSFVADCLETLEEIGLRAADDFRAAGGRELRLVPSLNAHPAWIETVARLVEGAGAPVAATAAAASALGSPS